MEAASSVHAPAALSGTPRAWLRLRVQLMIAKIDYRLNQMDDGPSGSMLGYFLAANCELAMVAAEGGLNGFAATCLRMAERIEPIRRSDSLPDPTLRALAEWMLHADRYLRRPSSRVRSLSLVTRLNDSAWGVPLTPQERDRLIAQFASDSETAGPDAVEGVAH